jgi:hypothetical protein
MKAALGAFVALVVIAGAIYFAREKALTVDTPSGSDSARRIAPSVSRAPASARAGASAPKHSLSPEITHAIERAILALKLDEPERSFFLSPDANRFERMFKKIVIATRHSKEMPGNSPIVLAYIDEMKVNQKEAMDAVVSVMDKMPQEEFMNERSLVLDTATDLDEQKGRVHELARSEMNRSAMAPSDGQAFFPLLAHSIAMRMSESPEEAFNDTLDGFQSQPDPGVRNAMAAQLLASYPQYRDEVAATLERMGTKPSFDSSPPPRIPAESH